MGGGGVEGRRSVRPHVRSTDILGGQTTVELREIETGYGYEAGIWGPQASTSGEAPRVGTRSPGRDRRPQTTRGLRGTDGRGPPLKAAAAARVVRGRGGVRRVQRDLLRGEWRGAVGCLLCGYDGGESK